MHEQRVHPKLNEHGVTLLRVARTSRGISLLRLSMATGISYSRLSLIEGGLAIRLSEARKIASFYHEPVSTFFDVPQEAEAHACD